MSERCWFKIEEKAQDAMQLDKFLFPLVLRIQVQQLGHRLLVGSSDENRAVRLGRVS